MPIEPRYVLGGTKACSCEVNNKYRQTRPMVFDVANNNQWENNARLKQQQRVVARYKQKITE